MDKMPPQFAEPDLHKKWKKAKSAAEKAAKKAGKNEAKAYKSVAKAFKAGLGPSLDKWVKAFPDYAEMDGHKRSVDKAVKKYVEAIGAGGLGDIGDDLAAALGEVASELDDRHRNAKATLDADVDRVIKESLTKQIPPIVVLKTPDIGPQVAKALTTTTLEVSGKVAVEVVLDDKKVLAKIPADLDDADLAAKIVEAANFSQLIADVAAGIDGFGDQVAAGRLTVEQANKALGGVIDEAVDAARLRAAEEAGRVLSLKGDVRWIKGKRVGGMVLTGVGIAAGVAGLALTPLTFGASTVAGGIGVMQAAIKMGNQIYEAAAEAEELAADLADRIKTLADAYETWSKNSVGASETGKTLVNTLLPADVQTIKKAADLSGTVGDKIKEIEVATRSLSPELGSYLRDQAKASAAFAKWEKSNRTHFTDSEIDDIATALGALATTEALVQETIDSIEAVNKRTTANRDRHDELTKALAGLKGKQPTWSVVASTVIELAGAIGFAVAGNVNTPDPYQFAQTAADVIQQIGNANDGLSALADTFDSIKSQIEDRR